MTDDYIIIIREPVCFMCKNLIVYPYCLAYPNGIPDVIRSGENKHDKNIDGDNNIIFEKLED